MQKHHRFDFQSNYEKLLVISHFWLENYSKHVVISQFQVSDCAKRVVISTRGLTSMQEMKTYHSFGFKLCGKCKKCGDTTALALKLCKKRGNATVLASKLCKRCGISTVLASKLVKLKLCKACGNITVFLVKKHGQIVCFISVSQQDMGCQADDFT